MDGAVYVRPSRIRGAGGGLFAARPLRKGELIGRYTGVRVPKAKALDPDYTRGYLMLIPGIGYVDSRDPGGRLVLGSGATYDVHGWTDATWRARFRARATRGVDWRGAANLTRFVNASTTRPANCVLTRKYGGAAYVTSRDVLRDEELIANYGPGYWKTQNDNACFWCERGGWLVECDSCHRSVCFACAHIASHAAVPKGNWYCAVCCEKSATKRPRPS